jgi:Tol biopolymer transport system component
MGARGFGLFRSLLGPALRVGPVTVAFVLVIFLLPAAASAARGVPLLVSRAGGVNGAGGTADSLGASISADGRFVAFESSADNLSAADNNSFQNVFVRDTRAGTTTLVSRASGAGGAGADGHSLASSISADGRFVAFESDADNLSTGDNNSFRNVFVRDTAASTTTLASVTFDNSAGANEHSFRPSISADGRFVAFDSHADNLSLDDLNSVHNVFVRDTGASTTTLVNYGIGGAGADGSSSAASISAGGRFVAFASDANNLSSADNNLFQNVFVRDTGASTTTLASRTNAADGPGADGDSFSPSIAADGRFVAFTSFAYNLSADDVDGVFDVFVRDTGANTTTLASRTNGVAADGFSLRPSISADGRFVAFDSLADNLSADDVDGVFDVFVRDTGANTTMLASRAGGAAADGPSVRPSISADGRFVAFDSRADNLSAADVDGVFDVFRQDLVGPPPACSDVARAVARDRATSIPLPCADADGDPLTRSIVAGPSHGTLAPIDQAAGTVIYIPDPGYTGPDSFRFRGADASGTSNTATARLTVAAGGGGGGGGGAACDLALGKAKKNKRKGTAKLSAEVGCAGVLEVDGKGVKPADRQAAGAGEVKLPIKAKGKRKKKLRQKGKVKVVAKVTLTPSGGAPVTERKRVKLVRRAA